MLDRDQLSSLLSGPNFGRLARLTVVAIMTVGIMFATATWLIQGGDLDAYVNATYILGSFIVASISGGLTTTFGKSETQYRVKELYDNTEEYYGADKSNGVDLDSVSSEKLQNDSDFEYSPKHSDEKPWSSK